MKWRPAGWANDYANTACQSAFEDGADAMLKALKEKGAWMTPEQMKLLAPDRKYPYGYLVFIPTEGFDWDAPWVLPGWRVVVVGKFEILPNAEPSIFDWTFREDPGAPGYSANELKRMAEESAHSNQNG